MIEEAVKAGDTLTLRDKGDVPAAAPAPAPAPAAPAPAPAAAPASVPKQDQIITDKKELEVLTAAESGAESGAAGSVWVGGCFEANRPQTVNVVLGLPADRCNRQQELEQERSAKLAASGAKPAPAAPEAPEQPASDLWSDNDGKELKARLVHPTCSWILC